MEDSQPPEYVLSTFRTFVNSVKVNDHDAVVAFRSQESKFNYLTLHPIEKEILIHLCGLAQASNISCGSRHHVWELYDSFNGWFLRRMLREIDPASAILILSALVYMEQLTENTLDMMAIPPPAHAWGRLHHFVELMKNGQDTSGQYATCWHMARSILYVAKQATFGFIHSLFKTNPPCCENTVLCSEAHPCCPLLGHGLVRPVSLSIIYARRRLVTVICAKRRLVGPVGPIGPVSLSVIHARRRLVTVTYAKRRLVGCTGPVTSAKLHSLVDLAATLARRTFHHPQPALGDEWEEDKCCCCWLAITDYYWLRRFENENHEDIFADIHRHFDLVKNERCDGRCGIGRSGKRKLPLDF
ncbi:uncharacterized protein P884DRAFT_111369 [Thermothelomyces heterothallicus CBS 202.75]|uniref:uncharacterized protein n=1 Tax=Thermothelomyces heterothallicus CBS 202.75 TaxID=1149848 RepID=UPI003743AB00